MAVLPPDTVVVITGASSGIGRAAAQAFAKKRARLVLAARDNAALEAAAGECHALGAEALALAADLSETGCAERVRLGAVETFGRIDVWVNSAAVLLLGRFADLEPREFRCVVETNVLGYANGSRAALEQFRHQGGRGTLINVSSILGVMSEPYASACVASKFAIRGLTACIRQEMRGEPGIHICTILPAAMDTPIYEKAGNHFGHRAHSILPVYPAERAAIPLSARRSVRGAKFTWADLRIC